MSDWIVLGLLAIGFYLYECCNWTPAAALACMRRPLRRSWSAAFGGDLVGNESGGFAFSDPMTFSGNIVHAAQWPVAVSPDGVSLDNHESDRFWAFDSIRAIAADEKQVRFNGEVVCRAISETHAAMLVAGLEKARTVESSARAAVIRAALRETFDDGALAETWGAFLRSSRRLSMLAALPLAWLAVITPVTFYVIGPLASWPYLLAGLFLSSLIVSAEFIRLHRRELPHGADRWIHAVSMTLFPIAAIRAADRISKEKLSFYSPLAVVAVFCDDAAGWALFRRHGFDLERQAAPASDDSPAAGCRAWYRSEKRSAFRILVKSLKHDPFAAPAKSDESLTSYCPRCHSQYGEDAGECADCIDVALVRLSAAETRREAKPRKRKRA
jgi:hypothetical protein